MSAVAKIDTIKKKKKKQSVLFFGEKSLFGLGLLPVAVFPSSHLLRARIRFKSTSLKCSSVLISLVSAASYKFPTDLLCPVVRHPLATVLGSVFFLNVALLS